MLGAVRSGRDVEAAVRMAESHLAAHTNALRPAMRGTERDPFPGQPEKNEEAAAGFKQVIGLLGEQQKPEIARGLFRGVLGMAETVRESIASSGAISPAQAETIFSYLPNMQLAADVGLDAFLEANDSRAIGPKTKSYVRFFGEQMDKLAAETGLDREAIGQTWLAMTMESRFPGSTGLMEVGAVIKPKPGPDESNYRTVLSHMARELGLGPPDEPAALQFVKGVWKNSLAKKALDLAGSPEVKPYIDLVELASLPMLGAMGFTKAGVKAALPRLGAQLGAFLAAEGQAPEFLKDDVNAIWAAGAEHVGTPLGDRLAVPADVAVEGLVKLGVPRPQATMVTLGMPFINLSLILGSLPKEVRAELANPVNWALFMTPWAMGRIRRIRMLSGRLAPGELEAALSVVGEAATARDVGAIVAVGEAQGVLEGIELNVARVRLGTGQTIAMDASLIHRVPESGLGATLHEVAEGLARDHTTPLVVTPGGMSAIGARGPGKLVLGNRFLLAPEAKPFYRGEYASGGRTFSIVVEEARRPYQAYVNSLTASGKGPGKLTDVATDIANDLAGLGFTEVDFSLATGRFAEVAARKRLFERLTARVKEAADLQRSVAEGRARVMVIKPMSGAQEVLPGLVPENGPWSPTLQTLARSISNNSYDARNILQATSKAAEAVQLPTTRAGVLYGAARSFPEPGALSLTRNALMGASNLETLNQMDIYRKMGFFQAGVRELFGEEAYRNIKSRHFLRFYKGPKPDPEWEGVIGTLADALEFPGQYPELMVGSRLAFSKTWQSALSREVLLTQKMGVPVNLIDMAYVPHGREDVAQSLVAKFLQPKAGRIRGIGGPTRPSPTRPRQYRTLREWSKFLNKLGEEPELDLFALYNRRLQSFGALRTDQVYMNGLLRAKFPDGTPYAMPLKKGQTPPKGWQLAPIGRARGRWALREDVVHQAFNDLAPKPRLPTTQVAEEAFDLVRGILLSSDLSFMTIQGYALFHVDPIKGLGRFAKAARVAATEDGLLMHMAQNPELYARYAQAGGVFYTSAIDLAKVPGTKQLIDRVPVASQLNEFGYNRFLPVLKVLQFQSMTQMLMNLRQDAGFFNVWRRLLPKPARAALKRFGGVEGKTDEQLFEAAADVINNIGGGINWTKVGRRPDIWGKMVLLTEGWTRANVGRLILSAKVGDPRGVLMRRWMITQLGMSAMISSFLSQALADRWPELDPRAADWLDIQTETGSIPFVPGKTYLRTLARTIFGVPWERDDEFTARLEQIMYFGEGREGQLPRAITEWRTGRDFIGRKIDNKWLHTGVSLLPIPLQGLYEAYIQGEGGISKIVSEAIGLNFIPKNPYDARNQALAQLGWTDPVSDEPITEYSQISGTVMAGRFDKENPEYTAKVREYQVERDRPTAKLSELLAQKEASLLALGHLFMYGEAGLTPADRDALALAPELRESAELVRGNSKAYLSFRGAILAGYGERYEDAIAGMEELEPQSATQKVVSGWYSEVIEPSLFMGKIQSDLMAMNEYLYRGTLDEDAERQLDIELAYSRADDPVSSAYRSDTGHFGPYFDKIQSFWEPVSLENVKFPDPENALKYPSFFHWKTNTIRIVTSELQTKGRSSSELSDDFQVEGVRKIFDRYGISVGEDIEPLQAQEIAEAIVSEWSEGYTEGVGKKMDLWFTQSAANMESFEVLVYWGIIEPRARMRPYLGLLQSRLANLYVDSWRGPEIPGRERMEFPLPTPAP